MADYATRKSADYSPLVVHFTKDKPFLRADQVVAGDPLYGFKGATALERLLNILTTRVVRASPLPWLTRNPRAVCFTECIWDGLVQLSEAYSPYGLVFSKRLVFEKGGGPALYVRGDSFKALTEAGAVPPALESFVQPFDPTAVIKQGVPIDFLHEREWRLPSDLPFVYSDLEYVLVGSKEDASSVIRTIGSANLPDQKVIPLDVYATIKNAWGTR